MLIIRRSNCINTTSGIVFSVRDRPVCRLRKNSFLVRSIAVGIVLRFLVPLVASVYFYADVSWC